MEKTKKQELEKWYDEKLRIHEQFCLEFKNIVEKIIKAEKIPFQSITYRVKEKHSFLDKCENYDDPINQIMDIAGVRIITYTNANVKSISSVIEKEFVIDPDNSMNKADQMEDNKVGYLSVHYVAKFDNNRVKLRENKIYKDMLCEIQVRTLLQHAWAEIEHDRNYKFGGDLPKEIKRRFFLAAGTLEMVDREFQCLSDDIDKYSKEVKEKTAINQLDIDIDSTSLFEYMNNKFNFDWIEKNFRNCDKIIIQELNDYGICKLEDIEKIIPNDYIRVIRTIHDPRINYLSTLRDIMIINDYKKYFENCWQRNWNGIDNSARQLYTQYKLPIDKIEKYVEVQDY